MTVFADAIIQPDEQIARIAINLATFLSVLCILFVGFFIATRFTAKMREKYAEFFEGRIDFLLWLVPVTAMGFSLFFSEYLGWTPCRLCWYQRAFIYPLAFLMLLHFFKPHIILRRIGFVMAIVSPFISAYHVYIEIKGEESSFCSAEVSCATVWFKSLGFLTIPGMALAAGVTIAVLLYMRGLRADLSSRSD